MKRIVTVAAVYRHVFSADDCVTHGRPPPTAIHSTSYPLSQVCHHHHRLISSTLLHSACPQSYGKLITSQVFHSLWLTLTPAHRDLIEPTLRYAGIYTPPDPTYGRWMLPPWAPEQKLDDDPDVLHHSRRQVSDPSDYEWSETKFWCLSQCSLHSHVLDD